MASTPTNASEIAPTGFQDMPIEVLERIMTCLDVLDWPKFGRINQTCQRILKQPYHQYHLYLQLNHMLDVDSYVIDRNDSGAQSRVGVKLDDLPDDKTREGLSSGMTLLDKTRELKERSRSWATLTPRKPTGIGLTGKTRDKTRERRRRVVMRSADGDARRGESAPSPVASSVASTATDGEEVRSTSGSEGSDSEIDIEFEIETSDDEDANEDATVGGGGGADGEREPTFLPLPDGRRVSFTNPIAIPILQQVYHIYHETGELNIDVIAGLVDREGRPFIQIHSAGPTATDQVRSGEPTQGDEEPPTTIPLWQFPTEPDHSLKGRTAIYELQEGIFLFCDQYKMTPGIEGISRMRPTHIRLLPLPCFNPALVKTITTESRDVGFLIADLTMDPTQDLIVVSEYIPRSQYSAGIVHRYHLLTLSTFQPHPLAAEPSGEIVSLSVPEQDVDSAQLLQVMDDILAVLVTLWVQPNESLSVGPQELRIWNWKTGQLLLNYRLPPCEGQASLALISTNAFILTLCRQDEITPELKTASIEYYTFDDKAQRTATMPHLVTMFLLPELEEGLVMEGLDIRPDPPFPARAQPPVLGRTKPFTEDPSKGILSFGLRIASEDEHTVAEMTLFVRKETLTKIASEREEAHKTEWDGPRGVDPETWYPGEWPYRVLTWETWMKENARLLNRPMSRSWVCFISGYRSISLFRPHASSIFPEDRAAILPRLGPFQLRMLDFDPVHIAQYRWAEANRGSGEGGAYADDVSDLEVDTPMRVLSQSDLESTASQLPLSDPTIATPRPRRLDPENPYSSIPYTNSIELHARPSRIRDLDPGHLGGPAGRGRVFKDGNIETGLAYLEVESDHVFKTDGVMLDEQRIILTAARATPDHNIAQDMHVLVL